MTFSSSEKPPVLAAELEAALERTFDSGVVTARRVPGGDIHEAYQVTFGNGRRAFVKTSAGAPGDMFAAEARGLAWLRGAEAVRIPEVLAASEPGDAVPFLALEWVEPGKPRANFDEELGHALAALHRKGADAFGLDHDNYIGSLPQANGSLATWSEFYIVRRLEPQLRRAVDGRNASSTMKSGFPKLFARMESRIGDPEPPARLHGDLWGGNLHRDEAGEPVLVDPAVYGGHREVDLAMMRLFGGFSERVFRAYDEVFPFAEGIAERVPLYQLYPLLVHTNLFGYGYVDQVEHALKRVV
ncbi:MAG: fructosamine kinase family protein [Polyangiales bacterium]|nr:fructosamine kinase family protein [Myxococcales bacterium]